MFAKNKRLLWQCDEFKKMDEPSRWGVAKRLKFCYRCLKGTTEMTVVLEAGCVVLMAVRTHTMNYCMDNC